MGIPRNVCGRAILGPLVSILALCGCPSDPCEGETCSGHGACLSEDGGAACDCEPAYRADGLACVPVDPCVDVDCSGHGVCVVHDDDATCECEPPYHAEGADCALDPLPDLTCDGGWVTQDLGPPWIAATRYTARSGAGPLRLLHREIPATEIGTACPGAAPAS